MLELLGFPVPFFVATFLGMRAGARNPQSVAEFCNETVIALAWAVASIFLWHCLWITSLMPGPWQSTITSGGLWTLGTGVIWLPTLMITNVVRALYARRP